MAADDASLCTSRVIGLSDSKSINLRHGAVVTALFNVSNIVYLSSHHIDFLLAFVKSVNGFAIFAKSLMK